MFGQGSPRRIDHHAKRHWFLILRRQVGLAACTFLLLSGLSFFCSASQAQEATPTVSIRAIWGGPAARKWKGKITLSDGEFGNTKTLGVEPFSASSTERKKHELQIIPNQASVFNGVELEVNAPIDSFLYIELQVEGQGSRFRKSVSIKELLTTPLQTRIDQEKNYVSIFRAPGDEIQIQFEKKSTVFETGERFAPLVKPNQLALQPDSNYRFQYLIRKVSSGDRIWHQSIEVKTDENGQLLAFRNPAMKLPDREGVYEFEVEISERRIRNFTRQSFNRKFDFVVLSPKPVRNTSIKQAPDLWRTVAQVKTTRGLGEFDPLNPASLLQRFQKQELHNGKSTRIVQADSTELLKMEVGGWHGFYLAIDRPNRPHILEIDFPAGAEMTTGISILQSNSKGQFDSLGADSGFENRLEPMTRSAKAGTNRVHRMVFWPRKEKVFVLIANRSNKHPSLVGDMRILAGPDSLVPLKDSFEKRELENRKREFLAFYEQPFFPDQFDAPKHFDETLNQSLTDWQFFYLGAKRLIETLRANGYTGAMITVMADGSTIYPSQRLRPGPKFDNAIFSMTRPDIYRKDVFEMLLRMFEREGLVLVPSFEFSATLPEIDRQIQEGTADASTMLVNVDNRKPDGLGLPYSKPAYNLLSKAVQTEIKAVLDEFSSRYTDRKAIHGMALKLGPDTFTILPGQRWGFDSVSLNRFLQDQKLDAQAIDRNTAIQRITRGDLNQPWRNWRIQQVTRFYSELADQLAKGTPKQRLYLAGVELLRDEESHSSLAPNLRWTNDYLAAMRNLGLDPASLDQVQNLTVLRANRVSTGESLPMGRVEHELGFSAQKGQIDQSLKQAGDLFAARDHWVHYSQLQKESPFHLHPGALLRLQPLVPTGARCRERFAKALAGCDSKMIAQGGLVVLSGQEPALDPFISVFTSLPKAPMKTLETSRPEPVVLRQVSINGSHYFYVVNQSPWPVKVQLQANQKWSSKPQSLSNAEFRFESATSDPTLQFELEPYGLVGGKTESETLEIVGLKTTVDSAIAKLIQDRITHLRKKMALLDTVQAKSLFENGDFERESKSSQPPNWHYDANRMYNIQVEKTDPYEGKQCLRLDSEKGVVWMRSQKFAPPETGRLSISVWLRIEDSAQQPPLRLAIQGKHFGKEYYRFANVGSLVPDARYNQIGKEWKRFAVHFDDLPPVGLTDLQVGFDLMGPGKVWVDHLQVFDRWFDENDRKSLTKTLALAGYQLVNKGDLNGSRQMLNSYWPQFIDEFIKPVNERRENESQVQTQKNENDPVERSSSLFDRVRFRLPNRVLKIR